MRRVRRDAFTYYGTPGRWLKLVRSVCASFAVITAPSSWSQWNGKVRSKCLPGLEVDKNPTALGRRIEKRGTGSRERSGWRPACTRSASLFLPVPRKAGPVTCEESVVTCREGLFEGFALALQRRFPNIHNGPQSEGDRSGRARPSVLTPR